jgi:drug/metabolite transporter (DMT)-like permease
MNKPLTILIGAIMMLATAPNIVKLSNLKAMDLLLLRLLIVTSLLSLFFLRYQRVRINKKEALMIASASFALFLHFYTWFMGIPKLPIAVATLIYATNPISTAFFSFVILKERLYLRHLLGLFFSLSGIYLSFLDRVSLELIQWDGVLWIIMAALFYSLYMVISKAKRLDIPNTSFNFYLNGFTAVIALIVYAAICLYDKSYFQSSIESVSVYEIQVVLALALFPSLLGHTLVIYTLPHFNMNFISIIKLAGPPLASVYAIFIFNEPLSFFQVLGFLMVTLGVLFSIGFKKEALKDGFLKN